MPQLFGADVFWIMNAPHNSDENEIFCLMTGIYREAIECGTGTRKTQTWTTPGRMRENTKIRDSRTWKWIINAVTRTTYRTLTGWHTAQNPWRTKSCNFYLFAENQTAVLVRRNGQQFHLHRPNWINGETNLIFLRQRFKVVKLLPKYNLILKFH